MCKILAFSNSSLLDINQDTIRIFQKAMNYTDKDGFGYAVLTENNKIFGERTLEEQFQTRFNQPKMKLPIKHVANKFGKKSPDTKAAIFHARMSTNEKTLAATHPFTNDRIALIHNGVVHDQATKPIECKTSNDTEILFQYWIKDEMASIEKYVSGYYALAVLDAESGYLHIVKDDRANLVATYCNEIDSYVFATNKSILDDIFKNMEWELGIVEQLEDNVHITMSENEVLHTVKINPVGNISNTISMESIRKSLGYDYNETLGDAESYKAWSEYKDSKYTKGRWKNDDYYYDGGGK